jgi:hypothetical protein
MPAPSSPIVLFHHLPVEEESTSADYDAPSGSQCDFLAETILQEFQRRPQQIRDRRRVHGRVAGKDQQAVQLPVDPASEGVRWQAPHL